jgi:hypothetical protein
MAYSQPATCNRCGTAITKTSPRQKYCLACACEVHQEQQREAVKRYLEKLREYTKKRIVVE